MYSWWCNSVTNSPELWHFLVQGTSTAASHCPGLVSGWWSFKVWAWIPIIPGLSHSINCSLKWGYLILLQTFVFTTFWEWISKQHSFMHFACLTWGGNSSSAFTAPSRFLVLILAFHLANMRWLLHWVLTSRGPIPGQVGVPLWHMLKAVWNSLQLSYFSALGQNFTQVECLKVLMLHKAGSVDKKSSNNNKLAQGWKFFNTFEVLK